MEQRITENSSKKRILRSAEQLFLSKGYEATRLDDIVREACVSKTTIYQMFGGKEELCIALNNQMVERIIKKLSSLIPSIKTCSIETISKDLIVFAQNYLNIILSEESGQLFKLNLSICDRFKSKKIKYFIPCSDEFMYLLSKYFKGINSAGLLNIPDTEIAAQQFSSLIRGSIMCHAMFKLDDKYDEEYKSQYVVQSVKLFIKAHQHNNSSVVSI